LFFTGMLGAYESDSDEDQKSPVATGADKPRKKVITLASLPVSRKVDFSMKDAIKPAKRQRVEGAVDVSSAKGILASLPKAASTKEGAASAVRIEPLKRSKPQQEVPQVALAAQEAFREADDEEETDNDQHGVGETTSLGSFFTLPGEGHDEQAPDPTEEVDVFGAGVGPMVPQGYDATAVPTWEADDVKSVSRQTRDDMLASHPLVKAGLDKAAIAGMTEKELRELSGVEVCKGLHDLHHTELPNSGWKYENYKPASGSEILLQMKGRDLSTEAYCTEAQKAIRVTAPTITQKRKSQINWLAADAQANEAKLQQQMSEGRQTKSQTYMKYGW